MTRFATAPFLDREGTRTDRRFTEGVLTTDSTTFWQHRNVGQRQRGKEGADGPFSLTTSVLASVAVAVSTIL